MDITTIEQFAAAVRRAQEAASAYYDTDELLMSDSEYDQLLDAISKAQEKHGWDSDGLLDTVAAGQSRGGDRLHPAPMGSLEKVHDLDELAQWCLTHSGPVLVEPKLDGLAIRAVYRNGELFEVVTRGDGSSGEDVTQASHSIAGLPRSLGAAVDIELRGEVYMTDKDFEVSNASRVASGKPAFANPRNAVAGTLRNTKVSYTTSMSFACYGTWPENAISDDHQASVENLAQWGVTTAGSLWDSSPTTQSEIVVSEVERLGRDRGELGFPIDGAVIKVQLHGDRERAGYGTKAPKWAIAYKYAPAEATSTLRDIEVSVGRTGRITLRAVIDPVDVGGVTITHATLHNPAFVTSQGLGIGSSVMVVRAGDVIPRVTAAVGKSTSAVAPWEPPEECPQCGERWNKGSLLWRCLTLECSTTERLVYAVSRSCLDIDGMSEAVCAALVQDGKVNDVADLFSLSVDDIATTQLGRNPSGTPRRIGTANARKIFDSINKARALPAERFIAAVGLVGVGLTLARRMVAHFPTLVALKSASKEGLESIDGIGAEKASTILTSIERNVATIDRLIAMGLGDVRDRARDNDTGQTLAGMRIAISGAMDSALTGLNREQVRGLIERNGGVSVSSVTSKTTHLVTNETTTTKAATARKLGVTVITPRELSDMLGKLDEES